MRVIIVDDEPIIRMDLKEILESKNCLIVGEAFDGETAICIARNLKPDVVIMDIKLPGNIDGINAARIIMKEKICPVIMLTAYSQQDLIEKATDIGIFGYLVKPVKEDDVYATLKVAMSEWQKINELLSENKSLKTKIDDRKIIEKAKGMLMKNYGIDENEAYNRIRIMSMNERKEMVEIAKMILTTYKIMKV